MNSIKGKQGIRELWQGTMDIGKKSLKLKTVEVQPCESSAIEMGTYILSGEGGSMIDKGKFIVAWQKQNGGGKLHKDIWNSSVSNQPA